MAHRGAEGRSPRTALALLLWVCLQVRVCAYRMCEYEYECVCGGGGGGVYFCSIARANRLTYEKDVSLRLCVLCLHTYVLSSLAFDRGGRPCIFAVPPSLQMRSTCRPHCSAFAMFHPQPRRRLSMLSGRAAVWCSTGLATRTFWSTCRQSRRTPRPTTTPAVAAATMKTVRSSLCRSPRSLHAARVLSSLVVPPCAGRPSTGESEIKPDEGFRSQDTIVCVSQEYAKLRHPP